MLTHGLVGFFEETAEGNFGNGTSNNTLSYTDLQGHTYDREVDSVNDTVVSDHQGGNLAPVPTRKTGVVNPTKLTFAKPRFPGRRTVGGGQ
jgi:hypothetical protein